MLYASFTRINYCIVQSIHCKVSKFLKPIVNSVARTKSLGWSCRREFTFKSRFHGVFRNSARESRERGGGGGGLTRPYLLLRTSDFHWTDAACPGRPGIPERSPWYRGGALPPNNSSHIIAFIAHWTLNIPYFSFCSTVPSFVPDHQRTDWVNRVAKSPLGGWLVPRQIESVLSTGVNSSDLNSTERFSRGFFFHMHRKQFNVHNMVLFFKSIFSARDINTESQFAKEIQCNYPSVNDELLCTRKDASRAREMLGKSIGIQKVR